MPNRKLIYHVAISIDGFIAQENGDIEYFPKEGGHIPDYIQALTKYDTALMGRMTYEFGYRYGLQPGDNPYPHMQTYVYSTKLRLETPDHNLKIIRENILFHVRRLKEKPGPPLYLCGGGILASYLLKHQMIDELHLKYCPIIMGKGKPLFVDEFQGIQLVLKDKKEYDNSVLLLEYDIAYE